MDNIVIAKLKNGAMIAGELDDGDIKNPISVMHIGNNQFAFMDFFMGMASRDKDDFCIGVGDILCHRPAGDLVVEKDLCGLLNGKVRRYGDGILGHNLAHLDPGEKVKELVNLKCGSI